MANRFGYKNWLYTDTLIKIADLPRLQNCFRINISTYRSKDYGFIPVLSMVPFECNGTERDLNVRSMWRYNVPEKRMNGSDPFIYVKKGYKHLFRKPFIPASPIIRVSDIIPR
jgi:hypothetical protein